MTLLLRIAYRLLRVWWFFTRPITVGVRILMVRDGSVLLVRHSYQDAWFLPGGGVKRNETLEQAIKREVQEECGAELRHLQLLGIFTQFNDFKHDHVTLFLSHEFSLTGEGDIEIERVAFFSWNDLPPDVSPGSLRRIQAYRRGDMARFGEW
ncbi:MAG: NUDIX domain-containing protein [Anaerolineales bacterium]|jgi:ADP-ribose pyrophosphatase YjhB (NUDIX family)